MITCHKTTLPNGLRLIAAELPHLHSVEIAVYVKVGGRYDAPEKAGLSHFLEHMLFRGTRDYPTTLELEAAFEEIGGSVNAATDSDSTCYYSRVHPQKAAEAVGIFSSMLLRPTMQGIETEKKIITEEALEDINERGEDINLDNLASRLLWPAHPLGMPTVGTLETINGFTEEDMRRHMKKYYIPGNAVIVAAGRVDRDSFFAACERHFGSWKGTLSDSAEDAPNGQDSAQSLFMKDFDSQVSLQIAFRGFSRDDRRIMACRLIRRILCGGGSSRLLMSLRENLGIVYSVSAGISAYEETGCFALELSTAPENFLTAVDEVLKETCRLSTEPVGAEELDRVKSGYYFDLDYSRDSTYEMGVRYGWGELMGILRDIEEDQAEAAAITSEALRETARTLFAPHNINMVAVGPWKAADKRGVKKIIDRYVKSFPQ
ncbi:MAG TPA: pitrilysin family protein [Geobacteraceae bacterium]|nr:pitrilysin family protein [Geobacteraceae bacterium]